MVQSESENGLMSGEVGLEHKDIDHVSVALICPSWLTGCKKPLICLSPDGAKRSKSVSV